MKKQLIIILLLSFQAYFESVSAQLKPNNLKFYNESEGVFISDIITDK